MRISRLIILLLALFLVPGHALAKSALDTTETGVNEVLKILKDSTLRGEGYEKEKKEKIWKVLNDFFDFVELSKRTIGKPWKEITTKQRDEFVRLYKSVLEDAYMERILAYSGEKIVFDKEIKLSEKKTEVQTRVITRTAEIPISYRMLNKGGKWAVYDVIIEGISLIRNYRTQFREILANETFDHLLEVLREKVEKAR